MGDEHGSYQAFCQYCGKTVAAASAAAAILRVEAHEKECSRAPVAPAPAERKAI